MSLGVHVVASSAVHAIGLFNAAIVIGWCQQSHHVGAAQDQGLPITSTLHLYFLLASGFSLSCTELIIPFSYTDPGLKSSP